MEKFKLKARIRDIKKESPKGLRLSGEIPCVLYGKHKENINLAITKHDFRKLISKAGTSAIVLLEIKDNESKNVLVQDVDYDPLTAEARHLDFYEVSMKEKITTIVPLRFVGDSAAVIELGGSLMTSKDEIEIECLPADLPHEIEVDISVLDNFDAAIHISDLKVPQNVEVKENPEDVVASVEPPRSEEELAELEEPVEVPEIAEETAETEEEKPEENPEQ